MNANISVDFREILTLAAKDLVSQVDNPLLRSGWVIYLLEAIERNALNDAELEHTLELVRDAIDTRLKAGEW